MKYLYMRLPELLEKKRISRTRLCKDLNLERTNVNRYYRNEFQRIDSKLIAKLCTYFQCDISDLLELREAPDPPDSNNE